MVKKKCPKGCKPRKKRRGGGKSPWIKHVMKEFNRNKSAGFAAALRRAKKTWKK